MRLAWGWQAVVPLKVQLLHFFLSVYIYLYLTENISVFPMTSPSVKTNKVIICYWVGVRALDFFEQSAAGVWSAADLVCEEHERVRRPGGEQSGAQSVCSIIYMSWVVVRRRSEDHGGKAGGWEIRLNKACGLWVNPGLSLTPDTEREGMKCFLFTADWQLQSPPKNCRLGSAEKSYLNT